MVAAAVRAGYVVRVAIRREVSFAPSVEVKLISDLRNKIEWDPILQDVDIVVHAAGLAHADQTDDAFGQFDQINWLATARLTAAAKAANIKRFVYISSVRAQIGPTAPHIIRESDFPMPTDYYGRSKLAAETAIKAANISYTILRPVVVYGPHAKGNIHTLVRIAALPFPLPFKDFIHRRSLVALDNLVAAILFVLEKEKAANETFLVAGPRSLTLAEIIAILRTERYWQIANVGFRRYENHCAFSEAAREQTPEDDAGCDKRQCFGDVLAEHDGEQEPQRPDHRTHRNR